MEQKKFLRARKAHSYTALPQKTRKMSNKQPKLPPKRLRKRRAKPKLSKRKEVIKDEKRNKTEIK